MDELLSITQFILLLLLDSRKSEKIRGKLWIEKEIFLLTKAVPKLKNEFDFEPDLYGPFSEIVDSDVEALKQMSLIDDVEGSLSISKIGKELLSKKEFPSKLLDEISRSKDFLNDLSRDELLGYIYQVFPDTSGESVAFEKIKPRLKNIALNLLKKGKISLGLGAKIAGISYAEFLKIAKSHNLVELSN